MTITGLKKLPNTILEEIEFDQVIQVIEDNYIYTPSRFTNGNENSRVTNEAGCNEGPCKIFSFAQLNNLNENQTPACFGKFYRQDVLDNPHNNDHANIRNFIEAGWNGTQFDAIALAEK